MTLTNKLLITTIILTILTCGAFLIYKEIEISDRQKRIEESVISQKKLTDDLVRSMSQYATSDQITNLLKDNKVDLDPIKKDMEKLQAKIDSVNIFITNSLGYDWHNMPSDGSNPSPNAKPPEKVICDGKEIDCIKDPNNYLITQQHLNLNERFDNLEVPFGRVTFDGSEKKPWSLSVPGREYKNIVISAKDEEGRVINYNQFRIIVNGKEYKIPIAKAETEQVFPDPIFRWFSPRLYLGLDAGLNISQLQYEFGPNLNLAIMNYGRYVQTPDFSILQLGVGAGLHDKQAYFVLTPFAYNVGKHFPFMMNTYLGPSLQVSTTGDIAAMLGLRLGL